MYNFNQPELEQADQILLWSDLGTPIQLPIFTSWDSSGNQPQIS